MGFSSSGCGLNSGQNQNIASYPHSEKINSIPDETKTVGEDLRIETRWRIEETKLRQKRRSENVLEGC